jgi:hypothetical protein
MASKTYVKIIFSQNFVGTKMGGGLDRAILLTPKIYDLTNSEIKDIRIQFRDAYGKLIPIRASYSSSDPTIADEIQQATFKIEIELAILE